MGIGSGWYLRVSFWYVSSTELLTSKIARGNFEMAAYIDKIHCFDCDATLLRKNLKQHYLRHHENKPPKFWSISTATVQSFFKNGSGKRTNSEIDENEEQSPSQNCSNFKRSKPNILGNEEEDLYILLFINLYSYITYRDMVFNL